MQLYSLFSILSSPFSLFLSACLVSLFLLYACLFFLCASIFLTKNKTNKARYSSDPTHTHKRTHHHHTHTHTQTHNRASNTETQTSNAATLTGRESVVEEDREGGRADSVWRGPLRSPCCCWRCRSRRKRACGEKSPSSSSPESATESFSQCSVTRGLLAPKALAVRLDTCKDVAKGGG